MVSSSQPPQQCQLCHATFTNYYELDEHVKAHATQHQNSALTATAAGISLTQNNPLLQPMKPLEYHCTHCAKQSLKQVFASLSALEQHVTHMHTGKGNADSRVPEPRFSAECLYFCGDMVPFL